MLSALTHSTGTQLNTITLLVNKTVTLTVATYVSTCVNKKKCVDFLEMIFPEI